MLSIVVIYDEKDINYLPGLIETIPSGCELILCKTEPSELYSLTIQKNYKDSIITKDNLTVLHYDIFYKKGDFSFSEIRNAAKSVAKNEWILSLDADERIMISQEEIDNLKEVSEKIGGINITNFDFSPNLKLEKDNEVWDGNYDRQALVYCRLFRKRFNWTYRVHERIEVDIEKQGFLIADSTILLKHIGYNSIVTKQEKFTRNLHMMYKELAVNPGCQWITTKLYQSLRLVYDNASGS